MDEIHVSRNDYHWSKNMNIQLNDSKEIQSALTIMNQVIAHKQDRNEYLSLNKIIKQFQIDKEKFEIDLEEILLSISSLGSMTYEIIELKSSIENHIHEKTIEYLAEDVANEDDDEELLRKIYYENKEKNQNSDDYEFENDEDDDYSSNNTNEHYDRDQNHETNNNSGFSGLTNEERAEQKASLLTEQFDLTPRERKLLEELLFIFDSPQTFKKIKELLNEEAFAKQVYLATLLRDHWKEDSKFQTNLKQGRLYRNLTYRMSLHFIIITYNDDIEEAISDLELLYDRWYSSHRLMTQFPSFFEYLHYFIYGY